MTSVWQEALLIPSSAILLFGDKCTFSFPSQYIQPLGWKNQRIIYERSSRYRVVVARGVSIRKNRLRSKKLNVSSHCLRRQSLSLNRPHHDATTLKKKWRALGRGGLWPRSDFSNGLGLPPSGRSWLSSPTWMVERPRHPWVRSQLSLPGASTDRGGGSTLQFG